LISTLSSILVILNPPNWNQVAGDSAGLRPNGYREDY
jgi:hypothetical protein